MTPAMKISYGTFEASGEVIVAAGVFAEMKLLPLPHRHGSRERRQSVARPTIAGGDQMTVHDSGTVAAEACDKYVVDVLAVPPTIAAREPSMSVRIASRKGQAMPRNKSRIRLTRHVTLITVRGRILMEVRARLRED